MYSTSVTIPAGTPKAFPQRTSLKLVTGTLNRVLVGFPSGCCGLARCAIFHLGAQIEPWNPDGYLGWDNYVYDIPCDHYLPEGGNVVVIKTWNLDDSYPHTLHFGFGMLPEKKTRESELMVGIIGQEILLEA